jgi:antitoxin component YwqK of YwqJK toxin-antitoxin module
MKETTSLKRKYEAMRIFLIIISILVISQTNFVFALAEMMPVKGFILQDDPLNGPKKEYYPSGKVCKEYILENGKISGSYKFFSEKGHLVSDQNFVDGEPNGYLKTYYENGQLKSEVNMKPDGDISGPSKEYFENGTLKKESNLTGDPRAYSGKTTLYFEDGKLCKEITVSEGKLVIGISYDKEGRVTSEESDGKNISYWYENNGKKHTVINGVEQK